MELSCPFGTARCISQKKGGIPYKMTGILVVPFGGNRSGLGGGLGIPRVFSLKRSTCTAGAFVVPFKVLLFFSVTPFI